MRNHGRSRYILILLLVSGCTAPTDDASEPTRPKNVVLILGDALRAKSIPIYGYDRPTAPFLSSLGDQGLLYENAFSHYSSTWATISNLFTGLPYSALVDEQLFTAQSRQSRTGGLAEANETLAELLLSVGVRSRGVSANPYLSKEHGFGQGFEAFHDWSDWDPEFWSSVRKFRAAEVNRVAFEYLDELASGERPWFLFLLYFETHNPYQAGPEHQAVLVDADYPRRDRNRGGAPRDARGETIKYLVPETSDWYTAMDAAHLRSLYDAEVRAFDFGVRDLFGRLQEKGLLEETIVIVSADHGESLFDRGYWGHGFLSRDEVQHVPMLVVKPDSEPRRITGATGTSDLFFSLLQHFGVKLEGERRVPWCMDLINGTQLGSVMLSEGPGKTRILRDSRYSLYRHLDVEDRFPLAAENGDHLYDRGADPEETTNLFEEDGRQREASAIRERLLSQLTVELRDQAAEEDPFLEGSEERLRRLRALGYVD